MPSQRNKLLLFGSLIFFDQLLKVVAPRMWVNHDYWLTNPVWFLLAAILAVIVVRATWPRLNLQWWVIVLLAGVCSNVLDLLVTAGVRDIWLVGPYTTNFADICIILGALATISGLIWPLVWPRTRKLRGRS